MNERTLAPSPRLWLRVVTLGALASLLFACAGGGFATPTPIPASIVRPVQPSPVYSTALPRFRLEEATPEPVFITPTSFSSNFLVAPAARAPAQPVMPQSPTAMGIALGAASLLDEPGGRAVASIPAGGVVTVTGRSADGRWLAAFTSNGVAGWTPANSLRLFGADDLTTVDRAISMAPVATLLAEAMLPVASPMSDYLASLTATPTPPPSASGPGVRGVVISNSRLNVRAEPRGDAAISAKLEPRAVAIILGKDASGRWLQVQLEDGVGWAAADFIRVQGGVEILPTIGVQKNE